MTIPSRPAPPPPVPANSTTQPPAPQQHHQPLQPQHGGVQKLTIKLPPPSIKNGKLQNSYNSSTMSQSSITKHFPAAKTRYAPTTNWSGSTFETSSQDKSFQMIGFTDASRKVPPPRPPPPRVVPNTGLKKPGAPPQSINVLSNLFGRKKSTKTHPTSHKPTAQHPLKQPQTNPLFTPLSSHMPAPSHNTHEAELISFDSPPSSPTLTQKSNSDCVSVDSFSSDSNFSSPNNGSVSQPESGFEDDFSASRATSSPLDPWEAVDTFCGDGIYRATVPETKVTAPVRNLTIVNHRIQNNNDNPLCNGKSLLPPAPTLSMPTIIKPKISQKPKAPKPPSFVIPSKSREMNNFLSFDQEFIGGDSPPMPSCPPPPPPVEVSLHDVVSGRLYASNLQTSEERPYGYALYDYDSGEDGDLSFRENDKIYILEKLNDEWLMGRDKRGCEGMFPANYIDIKVPLRNASPVASSDGRETKKNDVMPSAASPVTFGHECKDVQVRSLYTFVAEQPEDLSINENDLVTVLYRINEDWLYGEIAGRQGQFPANFLEYIPDNLPMP